MDLNEEGGQICRVKGREEGVWGREVLTLMARKLKQFPAPRKIIIYSSSVDGEDSLGEVYHRTVNSQDSQKVKELDGWGSEEWVRRGSRNCCHQCIKVGD